MRTIKLEVEDIKLVKSGVTRGHSWSISHIIDKEGVKYGTFNAGLYQIGGVYEVAVEDEVKELRNGNKVTNHKLLDDKKSVKIEPQKTEKPKVEDYVLQPKWAVDMETRLMREIKKIGSNSFENLP